MNKWRPRMESTRPARTQWDMCVSFVFLLESIKICGLTSNGSKYIYFCVHNACKYKTTKAMTNKHKTKRNLYENRGCAEC